jgi:hypothetical protein
MDMLPSVFWELRPQDFWRLYYNYKKRERQRIKMVAVQKFEGHEHDFEKFYSDLWYFFTETPKREPKPKKASFLELSKEEQDRIIESERKILLKAKGLGSS